jgi:hypothetical protein
LIDGLSRLIFLIFMLSFASLCYRNAYQIAGVNSFKGRLSELFHVLSDDIAAGMREATDSDQEPDVVMEAEIEASNYLEQSQSQPTSQSQSQPHPMTPSAAARAPNPGTPGTKRKAAERVGNSATRTRLQF